jgi:hypothetical protein
MDDQEKSNVAICEKVGSGGVHRLKHYLGHTQVMGGPTKGDQF